MTSERIDQIFQRRPPTANLLQITKKGLKMKLVRKLLCFKKSSLQFIDSLLVSGKKYSYLKDFSLKFLVNCTFKQI